MTDGEPFPDRGAEVRHDAIGDVDRPDRGTSAGVEAGGATPAPLTSDGATTTAPAGQAEEQADRQAEQAWEASLPPEVRRMLDVGRRLVDVDSRRVGLDVVTFDDVAVEVSTVDLLVDSPGGRFETRMSAHGYDQARHWRWASAEEAAAGHAAILAALRGGEASRTGLDAGTS